MLVVAKVIQNFLQTKKMLKIFIFVSFLALHSLSISLRIRFHLPLVLSTF